MFKTVRQWLSKMEKQFIWNRPLCWLVWTGSIFFILFSAIVPTNDFIQSLGAKRYLKLYIRQNKHMNQNDAMSQRQIITDFTAVNYWIFMNQIPFVNLKSLLDYLIFLENEFIQNNFTISEGSLAFLAFNALNMWFMSD